MKRVVYLAVVMVVCSILSGGVNPSVAEQTDFYTRLGEADSLKGGRVNVTEPELLKGIATKEIASSKEFRGYRVRIFFDNGQMARQKANQIKTQFEELFPSIACYLDYENPYFKVTVGNCLSAEEAVMLWNKVQGTFDRAFVIRENIPIEEITKDKTKQDTLLTQTINQF